jgi:ribosomal protein RSM22 (predicted rRNA methylase)
MQLPDDLREALEVEVGRAAPRHLTAASQTLSRRYRERHGRPGPSPLEDPLDARAYAAYRMPATYAALAAAFSEVRDRLPDWRPRTMLDVGGGPGTAAWAATATWPELTTITILERDSSMIEIGTSLAAHAVSAALQQAEWRRDDVAAVGDAGPAELTTAGYLLGELAPGGAEILARRLWERTAGACVIVEPGTPRGYALTTMAGKALEAPAAAIIAPLPITWPCLEHEADWLHFAERVSRTRLQRAAKDATLAYEDEKFSYVVASRLPPVPFAARVIRRPQIRSGHVRLTVCTANGIRHLVIPRSRKDAYRVARGLRWGSAISFDDAKLLGLSNAPETQKM